MSDVGVFWKRSVCEVEPSCYIERFRGNGFNGTLAAFFPDNSCAIEIACTIYKKFGDNALALLFALALGSIEKVKDAYYSTNDLPMKKQFSYILARQGLVLEIDEKMGAEENRREAVQDMINNVHLSGGYLTHVPDIEVTSPKSPEDIYKAAMRLGKDALVLTQTSTSRSVALLSQTYNEKKEDVEIPIITYRKKMEDTKVDPSIQSEESATVNLKVIKEVSPFDEYVIGLRSGLFGEKGTGTQIYISNLDKWGSGYTLE